MIKKLKEKRSTMLHLGDNGHRLLLASKLNLLLVPLTEETRRFKNPWFRIILMTPADLKSKLISTRKKVRMNWMINLTCLPIGSGQLSKCNVKKNRERYRQLSLIFKTLRRWKARRWKLKRTLTSDAWTNTSITGLISINIWRKKRPWQITKERSRKSRIWVDCKWYSSKGKLCTKNIRKNARYSIRATIEEGTFRSRSIIISKTMQWLLEKWISWEKSRWKKTWHRIESEEFLKRHKLFKNNFNCEQQQ